MQKHLLVTGGMEEALTSSEEAVKRLEAAGIFPAAAPPSGSSAPPNTVGVLASQLDAGCLAVVLGIGERHDALTMLLARALGARESHPEGSAERLLAHAERFADALSLPNEDRLSFERGVLLHDIGKMRLSNELLLTKALLTHEEWEEIRCYPARGAGICQETPGLEDIEPIVRNHQECYDGTGYPEGLEGDAIPRLARAARLVIVYCAMTSPRPYRSGHASEDEAKAFIESELGKHFDPALGRAFLDNQVGQPPRAGNTA